MKFRFNYSIASIMVLGLFVSLFFSFKQFPVLAQQPTGSVPTVTGTPSGPIATVVNADGANVRAGPSSVYYEKIGPSLIDGQKVPALGRSPGGDWIQIYYLGVPGNVGWVYAPLVVLSPGYLPIIEPPPTSTPRVTQVIDPTLMAAFAATGNSTQLPTFTPPPPLVIPTYDSIDTKLPRIPMGLVIFGLAFVGIFGAAISFLRRR
ncbi:MAG: SH3 domain-containing protein [Chloroflexota bacterium]